MKKNALYFGNADIYNVIRQVGGKWNDSKERPLVCLLESTEIKGLFWAIPVGNWEHRDDPAKQRINSFIAQPLSDLRSCYYHLGKTNIKKSIFFISDVIPITDKYIDREYIGYKNQCYIIKNPKLLSELEYKLTRILAQEYSNNNYFRQRITDTKLFLVNEMKFEKAKDVAAPVVQIISENDILIDSTVKPS